MKRVTGIGGVFFRSKAPKETRDWYQKHLGFDTDQWGTNFEWRQAAAPEKKGYTQWSPMAQDTNYFHVPEQSFMMNYRVENLEQLVQELRVEGVTILDDIAVEEYGKFIHVLDGDGRAVELWEPNDESYDKIVEGRT